jgi:hypothetical protein
VDEIPQPSASAEAWSTWTDDDRRGGAGAAPGGGGGAGGGGGLFLARLGVDPDTALSLATWLLTTTLGVLLFIAVLRRSIPIVLPAELSALVLDDRRGSGRGGARLLRDGALAATPIAPVLARPRLERAGPTGGRGLPGRPPSTFNDPPARGVIRRTIAYRYVRISAGPDDLRSAEVGRLDRDDEVEILSEADGFIEIRTPQGVVGWVPRVVFLGRSAPG